MTAKREYVEMLTVDPLAPYVDADRFLQFAEKRNRWEVVRPVCFDLSGLGVKVNDCCGDKWISEGYSQRVFLYKGYSSDGASGPACDTPCLRLAFLLHDIACTKHSGQYAVQGYFARHRLYRRVALAQGCWWVRAWSHWLGLVLGNWAYAMFHHD